MRQLTPVLKARKAVRTRYRNLLHYWPRVRRLTSTMSAEQHRRLARHAHALQRKLAPFVRDAALAYVGRRDLISRDSEARLQEVIVFLRRAGTNLNQIAKRANALQRVSGLDLLGSRLTVRELEQQVSRLLDSFNPTTWS